MQVIIKFEKLYYNNYIQIYYLRGLDGLEYIKLFERLYTIECYIKVY